jgi:predicted kinase
MLTLIRGLPGSGKSTAAKNMKYFHLEADMYFMRGGEYQFDASKLGAAHGWCQNAARSALECGMDVVVSNTFTQHWEMDPYRRMAEEVGAEFEVIVCEGDFGSVHNVPMEAIQRMKDRWED